MNYGYPQQQQQAQPPYMQQQRSAATGWAQRVRPVSSVEEVKASPIDFDGSVFYFPDIANKRIYTKFINMDGTAGINMYELREMPQETQSVNTSNFVTRDEFQQVIEQIKMAFMSPSKDEKVAAPKNDSPVFQF